MFIEEPTPADPLISHAQLQLELDRVNETRNEEWTSFLERANTRASLAPSNNQDELRTFVGKVPIWKVPVKVRPFIRSLSIKCPVSFPLLGWLGGNHCSQNFGKTVS